MLKNILLKTLSLITLLLLIATFKVSASDDYVTPEMFGAIGNGISDDSYALNQAFSDGRKVIFKKNAVYNCSQGLYVTESLVLNGNNAKITCNNYSPVSDDSYSFFRYKYGLTNYTVSISNLTIEINDTAYSYQNRHLYALDFVGARSISLDGVNILVSETDNSRHILTSSAPKLSIANCNFINKSKGTQGGCLWIDSAVDNTIVEIKNSNFMQSCSDEIFGAYGEGSKKILITDCTFQIDTTQYKKRTIMMSFYQGKTDAEIYNSSLYQYGNNNQLVGVIRSGDKKGRNINVSLINCTIETEKSLSVFCSSYPEIQSSENIVYNISNCTITNRNGPIIGCNYIYKYIDSSASTAHAVSCNISNSKLSSKYTLIDLSPNNIENTSINIFHCDLNVENPQYLIFSNGSYNNNVKIYDSKILPLHSVNITNNAKKPNNILLY